MSILCHEVPVRGYVERLPGGRVNQRNRVVEAAKCYERVVKPAPEDSAGQADEQLLRFEAVHCLTELAKFGASAPVLCAWLARQSCQPPA